MQTHRKALIATNDAAVSGIVALAASEQMHFETARVHDDEETLRSIQSEKPDILILDVALPGAGGLEICRKLRENPITCEIPIIMVTSEGDPAEKIEALEIGADDCVAKPLAVNVVVAHIKAVSRRALSTTQRNRLRAGPIDMDLDRWTVKVDGEKIEFTKREFRLLQVLLEAKGRALTRDFLLQTAWSHGAIHGLDTRTVDVHIGRLRRKLGPAGNYIITVRNVGFRFDILPDWIAGNTISQ
ncbi:MAG: response regulator transcription factor [Gammaproteobacteria bacterium]